MMKFPPVLIVICALCPELARGQNLPFPGSWAGDADWVADGARQFNWTAYSYSGAQYASISVSATGPGSLDFTFSLFEPYNPFSNGKITVTTGLGTTEFTKPPPGENSWGRTGTVRLAAGSQTVTFTLSGSRPGDMYHTNWQLEASLSNVRINPDPPSLADALDTNVPVTSDVWVPRSSGEEDYALLPPMRWGAIRAEITGPAVAVIVSKLDTFARGPSNPEARPCLRYLGPGLAEWRDLIQYNGGDTRPDTVFGFAVPAGTHTLNWAGTSLRDAYGTGITFRLDNLRILTSADYSEALEGGSGWSWGGNLGNLPYTQTRATRDGVDAVRLPRNSPYPAPYTHERTGTPSSLSANFTGPGVISFWWRCQNYSPWEDKSDANTLRVLRNGSLVPTPPAKYAWTKVLLNVPEGPQTVTWQTGRPDQIIEADGYLDLVNFAPRSPFQTWMAAQLGEARMDDLGVLDPMADVDKDGRANLMEYALQTSPVDPGRQRDPEVVRDPANPGQALLTWIESTTATGVTLTPETSTNLQNWLPLTAEEVGTNGTDRIMRSVLPGGGGRRYARLRASE